MSRSNRIAMWTVLIGSVVMYLVVIAMLAPASATVSSGPIDSAGCPNAAGWYVNPDEDGAPDPDLRPTQKPGGLLFEGKDLIHHATAPLELGFVTGGSFVAAGDSDKVVFKMETGSPYSTVVQTPDGKFWSTNLTGAGGQSDPVATVADLIGKTAKPGRSPLTSDTRVVTFGVGYWTETGSTLVKSISFHGHTYGLTCEPPVTTEPTTTSASPSASTSTSASPSASTSTSASPSASVSTSTSASPSTSGSASPSVSASNPDATCAQYDSSEEAQAAYLLDPVGLAELDADGDGYACEFLPDTSSGGGKLPLTGAPIFLVGGIALAAVGTGVLLFVLARRRKIGFTA